MHESLVILAEGVQIGDELHQSRPIKIGEFIFDVTPGGLGLLAFLGFIGHGGEIVTIKTDKGKKGDIP